MKHPSHFLIAVLFGFCCSHAVFPQSGPQAVIDSLLVELKQSKKDTAKVKLLLALSDEHIAARKLEEAISYAKSAKQMAISLNYGKGVGKSYYLIAKIHARKYDNKKAVESFQMAIREFEEIGFYKGVSNTLNHLGIAYFKLANYDKAIESWQKAYKTNKKSGDKDGMASNLNNIGLIYSHVLSNYPKALEYFQRALTITEKLGDKRDIAANISNIAMIYKQLSNYPKALEYYQKALRLGKEIKNKSMIASNLGNIGILYQLEDNYPRALEYYNKALALNKSIGKKSGLAANYGNMGTIYQNQSKYAQALEHFEKALQISKEIGNKKSISDNLSNIGYLYIYAPASILENEGINKSERYSTALKYTLEALEIQTATRNIDGQKEMWERLNIIYEKLGNSDKALFAYKNFIRIRDSILGQQTKEKITRLEVGYEYEKKMAANEAAHEKDLLKLRGYILIGVFMIVLLVMLFFGQRYRTQKNKQLLAKNKEVARTKANFFANISHEFRTPLTLILGPLESMLERENDPDKHTYAVMQRNAKRLLQQINEILDLSQIEAKQLDLQAQKINLNSFIKKILDEFKPIADAVQTTLIFESDKDNIQVVWDAVRLETILFNLISNSLKHTENGEVTVGIRSLGESGQYQIYIQDTGTGIPQEKLGKVFDRFYHDNPGDGPSTGIGLELARGLVELHGGKIEVESELGKGTVFTITMSLIPAFAQDKQTPITEKYSEDEAIDTLPVVEEENDVPEENKKPLLLIIEDNDDMRMYIKSLLDRKYEIIEAVDGLTGVEKGLAEIPDLIISDVMMPGKDGYEVCSELKNDIKTSHIPIVLLTAKSSPKDRIAGLEHSADYYLSKPFIARELILCIKNLIASKEKLREKFSQKTFKLPQELAGNSMEKEFMNNLINVMENQYDNPDFSVEQLGREVNMSRSQLHRKIHALTNVPASIFIRNYRLQCALEMIKNNQGTVTEIGYKVGFNSRSYFHRSFQEFYGQTPASVKNN